MYRFYLAAVDMLPGVLIFLPVYFLLNRIYFRSAGKSILCFLFSCYLCVVSVLVGLPTVTYIRPELNLNLIPFIGMIDDLKNSILNVLLFVPLGIMLPILWEKYRNPKKAILFGFGMSLTIELLQMLTFRATDINDLITNTAGAFLGYLCSMVLQRKFPAAKNLTRSTRAGEPALVLVTVFLVMFFVYPFVSAMVWDLILS